MDTYKGGPHVLHPDVRKLAGVVSAIPVEQFYEDINRPSLLTLPGAVGTRLRGVIAPPLKLKHEKQAVQLVTFGVGDVSTLLELMQRAHPEFTKEQAMKAMEHPETIAAHARLASTTHHLAGSIYRDPSSFRTDSASEEGVMVTSSVPQIEGRGCPAVFMQENNEISATPNFQVFTKWAGQLAVHASFRNEDDISA